MLQLAHTCKSINDTDALTASLNWSLLAVHTDLPVGANLQRELERLCPRFRRAGREPGVCGKGG